MRYSLIVFTLTASGSVDFVEAIFLELTLFGLRVVVLFAIFNLGKYFLGIAFCPCRLLVLNFPVQASVGK